MKNLEPNPNSLYAGRALYVGMPGSGKTTLMIQHLRKFPRVIFADPRSRYVRPRPSDTFTYNLLRDFDRVEIPQLGNYLRQCLHAPRFRILTHSPYFTGEMFEAVCRWATGCGNLVLAVDEAQYVCGTQIIGPEFKRVVCNGIPDGIWLFATTQRAVSIHNDLRASNEHLYIFKTKHPDDLSRLAAEGAPVYEQGVATMPPHRDI